MQRVTAFRRLHSYGIGISLGHPRPLLSQYCQLPSLRQFSRTTRLLEEKSQPITRSTFTPTSLLENADVYRGSKGDMYRNLKLFTLSTLGITSTFGSLLFLVESNLPMYARAALAATAIGTSGISTFFLSWIGKPYVLKMRKLPTADTTGGVDGIEFTTLDAYARKRITQVFDPDFLVITSRMFAKWELAEEVFLPLGSCADFPTSGTEETVAQTLNSKGDVLGTWIVRWEENGVGKCRALGKVVRHFDVEPPASEKNSA